jgi:putative endonuclease
MSNDFQSVFYTGVTNDLLRRVFEHRNKMVEGFTKKYNITKLLYYEECNDVKSAITREKQIKDLNRLKKIKLIKTKNSNFEDLYLNINS